MAWNGSDNIKVKEKAEVEQRKNKFRSTTSTSLYNYKALCAGLIVVAIGCAGIWWFLSGRGTTQPTDGDGVRRPAKIAEVTPQVVTNKAVESVEVKKPKPVDPNARPTKVGEVVNGYVMLPSGRLHRRTGIVTNSIAGRPKAKYAIFERDCNNRIAGLLTLKPGDLIVGTPNYNGRFKKDFVESLKETIVITEDDTPEQAQLKRDVIDARLQLKDAMDRGEDIEQIMIDTRAELQDMMRYKNEIRRQFLQLRNGENMTESDVEDVFNACNKMLEEKGIAPLTYGPITRRNLMRQQAAEQTPDQK